MNTEQPSRVGSQGRSVEPGKTISIPNDHWWHAIHTTDRMCEVLAQFFKSEYPYRLYNRVAKDTTLEEDGAFDAEVKALEVYFANQRKVSDV